MQAWSVEEATVLWNRPVARDTWRMALQAPRLADRIRPGQFLMLRLANGRSDPLLARPYALYDVVRLGSTGDAIGVEIVYLVVGKQTRLLTELRPGETAVVWGPLGNGFDAIPPARHLLLVAGGIGQTPFYAFAAERTGVRHYGAEQRTELAEAVVLCYGARSSDLLACVDDFSRLPIEVVLCTDDGSAGRRGLVTEAAAEWLDRPGNWVVVGCGPEPMLRALQQLCGRRGVPCYLSLEVPMACGFGACFSCAVPVRLGGAVDYRRCCLDGPVFDASEVVF